MAVRTIRVYGDPVLRQKATKVEAVTPELQTLIDDMVDTMRANEGIGLSANQVGEPHHLMVLDMTLFDEQLPPLALFNVEISEPEGNQIGEEGCLSVPDIREDVERFDKILVRFLTAAGTEETLSCSGLLSRVIQHELDHLHGIVFVDKIAPFKRNLLSSKLKKLAKGEPVT